MSDLSGQTAIVTGGAPAAAGAGAGERKRLVVNELCVEFGGLMALDRVSMSADFGERVGVIGPNGAGKTTLLNVICGFSRARSGTIEYGGRRLDNDPPHSLNRAGIARTVQGVGLCRGMTVLENVMLGAYSLQRCDIASALVGLWRSSREERRTAAAARSLLDRLGIDEHASRAPEALSYGIQKQVALARALMAEPSLLLLDEPASGLAEPELGHLADLIRDLGQRMTIVLVEHRVDLVMAVCDRVVVLNFGQVVAQGTPEEIRGNQAVVTAYLGHGPDEPVPVEVQGPGSA